MFLKHFSLDKLGKSEFSLLIAAYVLDGRNKCDFITEDGLDLAFDAMTGIANKIGCSFHAINTNLVEEFADFCAFRGFFSRINQNLNHQQNGGLKCTRDQH